VGAVKAAVSRYAMTQTSRSPLAAPVGSPGVQLPDEDSPLVPSLTYSQEATPYPPASVW
jgi:hypothetical protein